MSSIRGMSLDTIMFDEGSVVPDDIYLQFWDKKKYKDLIASEDFKSNPYKYLKHESKYVTEVAKKFIKESND